VLHRIGGRFPPVFEGQTHEPVQDVGDLRVQLRSDAAMGGRREQPQLSDQVDQRLAFYGRCGRAQVGRNDVPALEPDPG